MTPANRSATRNAAQSTEILKRDAKEAIDDMTFVPFWKWEIFGVRKRRQWTRPKRERLGGSGQRPGLSG
jgi:hypothetical protein